MTKVFAKHEPYENGHLGKVVEDMKVAGAPTLKVMKFDGALYATEGSHRLAAAYQLGHIPKLVIELENSNMVPDAHWRKVGETLPEYDFDHVLKLDLSVFLDDKYRQ